MIGREIGPYVVLGAALAGGMGSVVRARDRRDGSDVALKLLHTTAPAEVARFRREATALSTLAHPAIVRFVEVGVTLLGEPFLAMEWIDGDTLGDRVARQPLEPDEARTLLRRVAEGLALAHDAGIVHRDVTPRNVMLVSGDVSRPKLVDFGIARAFGGSWGKLTLSGMIVGTPGFMAPEQARGDSTIDARADVFSLGCLISYALTGKAPFVGEHVVAVLAKTILEPAARLRQVRRDTPADLDGVVARLLAKDPAERPADARAVLELLDKMAGRASEAATASGVVTTAEQRFACVVLAAAPNGDRQAAARVADRHGARSLRLADGTFVLVFAGIGTPDELAARAAHGALALSRALPGARAVVASGLAIVSDDAPSGDVVDRAAAGLSSAEPGRVRVDEQTARLLGDRVGVVAEAGGFALARPNEDSAAPTLLGKPTAFVGRERELAFIEGIYAECVEESRARVVVVSAPPGVGKTRLSHELVRRARRSGSIEVLRGAASPTQVAAPLGIISDALRRALRRDADEGASTERAAADAAAERLSRLLAVAIDAPASVRPDQATEVIAVDALRADDTRMFDALRDAWLAWLDAELARGPVLFVAEDLHWSDAGSISLLDEALRELGHRAFFVLALARPAALASFPKLFAEREPETLTLKGLSQKAARELALAALATADDRARAKIVERANGNPFHLEELIRAAASVGDGEPPRVPDTLPEAVLGMVQMRLDAIGPELSRVLRAASVYGVECSSDAVAALLGGEVEIARVEARLEALVGREVLEVRADDRAAPVGERRAYAFRHDLLREAAYAMLVHDERASAHRLAAGWLETNGAAAAALAEHWRRAGDDRKAAHFFVASARDALEAHDVEETLARARFGLTHAVDDDDRGFAELYSAEACRWKNEMPRCLEHATAAATLLPRGSAAWLRLAGTLVPALGVAGSRAELEAIVADLLAFEPPRPLVSRYLEAVAHLFPICIRVIGRPDLAAQLAPRIVSFGAAHAGELDEVARGRLENTRGMVAEFEGRIDDALAAFSSAAEHYRRSHGHRDLVTVRANLGKIHGELGMHADAEAELEAVLRDADRLGLKAFVGIAEIGLAVTSLARNRLDQALDYARRGVATLGSRWMLGGSHEAALATVLLARGDAARAIELARALVLDLEAAGHASPHARAVWARATLVCGDAAAALEIARGGTGARPSVDVLGDPELPALVLAECLVATGDAAGARAALVAAAARLASRAARLVDPAMRASLLDAVPTNRRIQESLAALAH